MDVKNYQLCYADEYTLWFHKDTIGKVYGDDWDDAPFQHNAEYPSFKNHEDVAIIHIIYSYETEPMKTILDYIGYSSYGKSVDEINQEQLPWVWFGYYGEEPDKSFTGGMTLGEVLEYLDEHDVRYALDNITVKRLL